MDTYMHDTHFIHWYLVPRTYFEVCRYEHHIAKNDQHNFVCEYPCSLHTQGFDAVPYDMYEYGPTVPGVTLSSGRRES